MRENFKRFKSSPYYGEYSVFLKLLLLIDVIFAAAIICELKTRIEAPVIDFMPHFMVMVAIIGIICTVIVFVFFYRLVVVPSATIEYIKEKYTLEMPGQNSSYHEALIEVLNMIDKITAQEYSGKLLQRQAELEAMKNQINPHFLYNTLDTIRGYAAIENAPLTERMIEILSHLFRYTVSSKQARVTVSQELGMAREFIKIQEYRTSVKIQMLERIKDDVQMDEYYVPKMILQPIIENAIKHGMPDDAVEFIIKINIYKTQNRIIISISDNGVGMDTATVAKINQAFMVNPLDEPETRPVYAKKGGTGIGLQNINKRIKLMFGLEYGLYCYSSYGEGTVFEMSLPA